MLTAVARDWRWPDVVAGIAARFPKFAFVLFCYVISNLNVPRDEVEGNIQILGKQNSLFPKGPVIKR